MADTERILDRVAKMLRLANDAGATEGERDNAMRMAYATLAKYNLDIAQVEDSTKKPTAGEQRVHHVATFYGRPWAQQVCAGIAELFFCSYILVAAKKATDTRHYFIGRSSNAITASLMAEFVVKAIFREAKAYQRATGNGNATFRSFALGAAYRVRARCLKLRADAELGRPQTNGNPGTALVLASVYETEQEQNRLYMEETFRRLGKSRGGKGITDLEAGARGDTYGRSVSLNRQVE